MIRKSSDEVSFLPSAASRPSTNFSRSSGWTMDSSISAVPCVVARLAEFGPIVGMNERRQRVPQFAVRDVVAPPDPHELIRPLTLAREEITLEAADTGEALRARQILLAAAQLDLDALSVGD